MESRSLQLLLRPSEVRDITGLSLATVYRRVADGTLPGIRIGGAVRIPQARLQQWFDRNTTGGNATAEAA